MIKAGGGSVTNISSAYGVVGAPGFAAYCGSKGAVRTFTKSTAIEHAAQGVRANSIHPGVAETPMLHGIFDGTPDPEATRAAFSAQQPNGFNGAPEDIAWGCVYLASDEARSEEHTSELQSLMRSSYAVFCFKQNKNNT